MARSRGKRLAVSFLTPVMLASCFAVVAGSPAAAEAADAALFRGEAPTPRLQAPPMLGELRRRYMAVDLSQLAAVLARSEVKIGFFGGDVATLQTLHAQKTRPLVSGADGSLKPGPEVTSWAGRTMQGKTVISWATLSLVTDGAEFQVTGSAMVAGRHYLIEAERGVHRLIEFDQGAFPAADEGEGKSETSESAASGGEDDVSADEASGSSANSDTVTPEPESLGDPAVIDVVVGHANETSTNAFNLIVNAINQTNTAFQNTGNMPEWLNLVAVIAVDYNQFGFTTDIARLRDGTHGLGVLRATRQSLGADIVGLMVPNNVGTTAGIGSVPAAGGNFLAGFFVASQVALPNLTMSHEIGHNLGGNHDPDNCADCTATPYYYSRGHKADGVASTLMAYANCPSGCPRQLQFSDPNTDFIGHPGYRSGLAGARDNRQSLLNLAGPIANYSQPSVVFQSSGLLNNTLRSYRPSVGATSTSQAVRAGTSPAIAGLPQGGSVTAFQSTSSQLYVWVTGFANTGLGMRAGTSPSVAALPNGSYVVAIQANSGQLWVFVSGAGGANLVYGMKDGTSPSITSNGVGGYRIAFQANTGNLYIHDSSAGGFDTGYGMKAGTSPSVANAPVGGYQVAFAANTQDLYTYTPSSGGYNTGFGVAAASSPSIAPNNSGFSVAFQANTSGKLLYIYTPSGVTNTFLGMASNTSPSLVAESPGDYFVAFQANTSTLWTYTTSGFTNLNQVMPAGTSPNTGFVTI